MRGHVLIRSSVVAGLVGALVTFVARPDPVQAWGPHGHEISVRAAVDALPAGMPAFFRDAGDQLVYLSNEPDRWRDERETSRDPALGGANGPEHYLNLEDVPPGALESDDRYAFARALGERALPGMSSYRMLELFQRVRLEFRLWREEPDPLVRRWIEARIINDAGLLGHYVTDAANPLHATVHFDGWIGANPENYATGPGFHSRFESDYVRAQVDLDDLAPLMGRPARVWAVPRRAIVDHIEESFGLVEVLYRLDREAAFDEANLEASHHQFTRDRLAAGALALRDAWWTAWVTSNP